MKTNARKESQVRLYPRPMRSRSAFTDGIAGIFDQHGVDRPILHRADARRCVRRALRDSVPVGVGVLRIASTSGAHRYEYRYGHLDVHPDLLEVFVDYEAHHKGVGYANLVQIPTFAVIYSQA